MQTRPYNNHPSARWYGRVYTRHYYTSALTQTRPYNNPPTRAPYGRVWAQVIGGHVNVQTRPDPTTHV